MGVVVGRTVFHGRPRSRVIIGNRAASARQIVPPARRRRYGYGQPGRVSSQVRLCRGSACGCLLHPYNRLNGSAAVHPLDNNAVMIEQLFYIAFQWGST